MRRSLPHPSAFTSTLTSSRCFPAPKLSPEEQAFLDGPVEKLCSMLNDWEIRRAGDLPEHVWSYIRDTGFMGMIIPK